MTSIGTSIRSRARRIARGLGVGVLLSVLCFASRLEAQWGGRSAPYQRFSDEVRDVLTPLCSTASQSTVRILSKGERAALGTVIDADGLILSKATELESGLEIEFADGTRLGAEIVARSETHDLALLKLEETAHIALVPIRFAPATGAGGTDTVGSAGVPTVGALVVSAAPNGCLAMGVISLPAQRIPAQRGFLGVELEDVATGARVIHVVSESCAARAGLKVDDVVTHVEGEVVGDREVLVRAIQQRGAGGNLVLRVLRGQETLSVTTQLGNRTETGTSGRLSGPVSERRSGFPIVLQHDTPLAPDQCGGPLLDLDGRVVGINIARAGRVSSYALPASEVQKELESLLRAAAKDGETRAGSKASTEASF
ncbi:MAG: PDZ domain-containing protein [Planctomycetota bacterium]